MIIKLDFVNRNKNDEGTRVYRDTKPITTTEGLTPIATLEAGASTFSDNTAIQGVYYHYAFETFTGDSSILSRSTPVLATPYTGPGSQTMLVGDYDRGYYGEVPFPDFITPDEVCVQMGITTPFTHAAFSWLKFAHQGKILFIPQNSVIIQTWNALYAAGLIFGVEGPGSIGTSTTTPVDQNKRIVIDGDEFIVRTMKGLPDGMEYGTPPVAPPLSEYQSTIFGVANVFTSEKTWGNHASLATTPIISSTELLAEQTTENGANVNTRANTTTPSTTTKTSTSMRWRPVLELVM